MNRNSKALVAWLAPFMFLYIYAIVRYTLYGIDPSLVGLPSVPTVESAALIEILISPLWVAVSAGATYLFGGIVIIQLIGAFSHSKLLRRKIVISGDENRLVKLASAQEKFSNIPDVFSFRSFGLTLALALGLNLMYTLLVQRYFSNIFTSGLRVQIEQYLLSFKLLGLEFLLALVVMPLLAIVLPLLLGSIKIRQIDSSPLHYYWLNFVYSVAGGASAALLLLNIFEGRTGPKEFVIASLVVYGLISWYAALGGILAVPSAQRRLAKGLLKLKGRENVYFGNIFVGENQADAKKV